MSAPFSESCALHREGAEGFSFPGGPKAARIFRPLFLPVTVLDVHPAQEGKLAPAAIQTYLGFVQCAFLKTMGTPSQHHTKSFYTQLNPHFSTLSSVFFKTFKFFDLQLEL